MVDCPHNFITRETAVYHDTNIYFKNGQYAIDDNVVSNVVPKTWYCPECGEEWKQKELDKYLKSFKKSRFGWRRLIYGKKS